MGSALVFVLPLTSRCRSFSPEKLRHVLDEFDRQITKMWELSKLRYEDPDAFDESAADMLPRPDLPDRRKPMVWDGRATQGREGCRCSSQE